MTQPLVSVIVPIYRIEDYLPKCIDSLLNQSFSNFELILVDDGSPDNCPEICDAYAQKDSRIKVIHKKNGGLLSARKAGLENATGKYVANVDGDDWVDKYYLDILYKLAEANGADLVVTGHFREFDGKIETIKPKFTGVFDELEIQSSILPKVIYNGRFCEHEISTYVWNKLFKRKLLEEILFDVPNEIVMGEDAAITYGYLSIAKKITISNIPLYYYRQRHDSIVKSIENPQMEYFRLGLLMNFLKLKLGPVLNNENIDRQLRNYLYSQILVRSGGIIYDDSNKVVFNPFIGLSKNSKVVVYSSGSFGQHILSTNSKIEFCEIVGWIDLDYHELSVDGIFVEPISSFDNTEFDCLIIATIDPSAHEAIMQELKFMGINTEMIVKINTDENEINWLLAHLGFDENFKYNLSD